MLKSASQGGCLLPGGSAPGGVSAPGGLLWGMWLLPGGYGCSQGVSAPGGPGVSALGVCLLRGVSAPGGGGIPACTEADPPREQNE